MVVVKYAPAARPQLRAGSYIISGRGVHVDSLTQAGNPWEAGASALLSRHGRRHLRALAPRLRDCRAPRWLQGREEEEDGGEGDGGEA